MLTSHSGWPVKAPSSLPLPFSPLGGRPGGPGAISAIVQADAEHCIFGHKNGTCRGSGQKLAQWDFNQGHGKTTKVDLFSPQSELVASFVFFFWFRESFPPSENIIFPLHYTWVNKWAHTHTITGTCTHHIHTHTPLHMGPHTPLHMGTCTYHTQPITHVYTWCTHRCTHMITQVCTHTITHGSTNTHHYTWAYALTTHNPQYIGTHMDTHTPLHMGACMGTYTDHYTQARARTHAHTHTHALPPVTSLVPPLFPGRAPGQPGHQRKG